MRQLCCFNNRIEVLESSILARFNAYYERFKNENGKDRYRCKVCLKVYSQHEQAKFCCYQDKPVHSCAEAQAINVLVSYHPKQRYTQHCKYPHGMARVVKAYDKAMAHNRRAHDREVIAELEALYPTPFETKPPRSVLQRLASCFYYRNWTAIRSIAIDLLAESSPGPNLPGISFEKAPQRQLSEKEFNESWAWLDEANKNAKSRIDKLFPKQKDDD